MAPGGCPHGGGVWGQGCDLHQSCALRPHHLYAAQAVVNVTFYPVSADSCFLQETCNSLWRDCAPCIHLLLWQTKQNCGRPPYKVKSICNDETNYHYLFIIKILSQITRGRLLLWIAGHWGEILGAGV